MTPKETKPAPDGRARVIQPADLIGAATAADMLGVDKSTLVRRIHAGKVPYVAQLDGDGGAYVLDRADIAALAGTTWTRPMPKVAAP